MTEILRRWRLQRSRGLLLGCALLLVGANVWSQAPTEPATVDRGAPEGTEPSGGYGEFAKSLAELLSNYPVEAPTNPSKVTGNRWVIKPARVEDMRGFRESLDELVAGKLFRWQGRFERVGKEGEGSVIYISLRHEVRESVWQFPTKAILLAPAATNPAGSPSRAIAGPGVMRVELEPADVERLSEYTKGEVVAFQGNLSALPAENIRPSIGLWRGEGGAVDGKMIVSIRVRNATLVGSDRLTRSDVPIYRKPVPREIVDTKGRQLSVTLLCADETTITFRKGGEIFVVALDVLSKDDRDFIDGWRSRPIEKYKGRFPIGHPLYETGRADWRERKERMRTALKLVGRAEEVSGSGYKDLSEALGAVGRVKQRLQGIDDLWSTWPQVNQDLRGVPPGRSSVVTTTEQPSLTEIMAVLGSEDVVERDLKDPKLTWHRYSWCDFGVRDGKVIKLRTSSPPEIP